MPSFTFTRVVTSEDPTFDIVFMHGLGASPADAWTYNPSRQDSVFWPLLLGDSFSNANVSIVGYPTSKLGKLFGGTEIGILTAAAGIADLLCSKSIGERPIIFICHSLGGIVLKAVLRQCADSSDARRVAIFDATQAVVLFGTPNDGASMGRVCARLPGLSSMQAAEIARADSLLLDVSQWFRGKTGPDKIRVHSFYETEPYGPAIVVDAASSNPGVAGCDPVPLTANHVEMCKLPSASSSTYISVESFVKSALLRTGHKFPPLLEKLPASGPHIRLSDVYLNKLFVASEIRHPSVDKIDERILFVEPSIYHQNSKTRLTKLDSLVAALSDSPAAVISGNDHSGKTLILKLVQARFNDLGRYAVRISGNTINNVDISSALDRAARIQYGDNPPPPADTTVLIDDFDECQLLDGIKEKIVSEVVRSYQSVVITSFSHAPSVLFAPSDHPDPDLFEISPFGDDALLKLVEKWKRLETSSSGNIDKAALTTYELLSKIFNQTDVDKFPGTAIRFLQLIEVSSGSDISFSSYGAFYEAMISSHISRIRPNSQNLDEAKNFVSHVAFTAYKHTASPELSGAQFEECLEYFSKNYFSSVKDLRGIAVGGFLEEVGAGYRFREEYEWYFLCARHSAKVLQSGPDYDSFVIDCASNIFRKQYANMIIFMAYFTTDNIILELLLEMMDGLFGRTTSWQLSDQQKTIMLGLVPGDQLAIQAKTDVADGRDRILREKIVDIIDQAEDLVARYTLPFLDVNIGDSEYVQVVDASAVDVDSYMRNLNALMRIHSVIGQILASRSGTFDSKTMLDCITRMVKASGRYVALNHAIAAVLVRDRQKADDALKGEGHSRKEEKFDKVERIFAFWSVFLSQAGLARYLSHDHAIRALKMLVGQYENAEKFKGQKIPFNFTSVMIIASMYRHHALDRDLLSKVIDKYGDKSSLVALIRVAVHIYSYYMPLSIQDKQWIGNKLNMPLRRIEAQRRKATIARVASASGKAPAISMTKTVRKKRQRRPTSSKHR